VKISPPTQPPTQTSRQKTNKMAKRKAATPKKTDKKKGGVSVNSGGGDGGEPESKITKTETTPPTPPPPAIAIDTSAIQSLAKQIVSAYQSRHSQISSNTRTNDHVLEECDDNGSIERTLWPWFLHCATANNGSDGLSGGEEVAFALAILSNRRGGGSSSSSSDKGGGGGGGGGDPQLWFVVDDYNYAATGNSAGQQHQKSNNVTTPEQRTMAFAMLLKNLLSYQETNSEGADDNLSLVTRTEVVKFLIASYSSMELRCKNTPSDTAGGQQRRGTILEGPLTDLVGVRLWDAIPRRKRYLEMKRDGLLRKRYGLFDAKRKEGTKNVGFLPLVVVGLLDSIAVLGGNDDDGSSDNGKNDNAPLLRGYISKVLELLLDLLSYPQTRTHVAPYLSSQHLVVQLALSKLYRQKKFVLFRQQVDMLLDSERMEVASSGAATTSSNEGEVTTLPYNDIAAQQVHQRAHTLQKILHRHHVQETSEVIFAGVGRVSDGKWLRAQVDKWREETLYDVCYRLRLVDDDEGTNAVESSAKRLGCTRRTLLTSIVLYHQSSRNSDAAVLSTAPLYPTEQLLWDSHSVPPGRNFLSSNNESLSLPKLNTRFLSAGDYLLRNFRLFRLESAYEIRGDVVDVIKRMRPALKRDGYAGGGDAPMVDYYGGNTMEDDEDGNATEFQGWARMGLELGSKKHDKPGLRLIRVDPPRLGERVPSRVIAELVLDMHHCASSLAKEWGEIGEFDNLFLVSVDATRMSGAPAPLMGGQYGEEERRIPDEEDCTFPERYGVGAVRGCLVLEVRDEAGVVLSDPSLEYQEGGRPEPKGKLRFLRVALDPAQFAADAMTGPGTDVYDTFNLVIRRHGRENNFRAVLETIRGLMSGGANSMYRSIPSWLMPVLLGYGGDVTMASYKSPKMKAFASKTTGLNSPTAALDYGDTFMDIDHLRDSFPGCDELIVDGQEITTNDDETAKTDGSSDRKKYRVKVIENHGQDKIKVEATSYPFPPSYNGNDIRFTPVQVNAIRSGLSPGLTTIIGPPGTGKTDVAVQIIANLYHSFPTQRTVIVTHSNAALNDIFTKVMTRGDVDERYMLRLGSGERNLTTTSTSDHDFTKTGRVAHILSRRGDLLEKVQRLSESLGVSGKSERGVNGAPSYTCETSEYFYFHHVKKRVDVFEEAAVAAAKKKEGDDPSADIFDIFPFKKYFSGFDNYDTSASLSLDEARGKIDEIKSIFEELAEYRPIELLRSQRQRTDYLLTKQARIVAMTCTHAAIARSHLVKLGFHYDNILMEEAGQMLDVETFVPLLLQRGESDDSSGAHSRLKRVCLIGDHNQLPPVVKNQAFSKFSRYDQSLFARLVRLGVPSIELNKQGRARPDIARLYSWRYDDLGDLDHVSTREVFTQANTGLKHTFQLINVEEFEGQGESTPTAYFYQNVGEAEYAVALFQYMVLLGYPPEKISILTTYNGQKDLLLDILSQRCGQGTPLAGVNPGAVSTVDQYQGQQNDYIILSLVRTKAVGHVRDIRRLVVAASRARLGLYVFCRQSLFCNCHELRRTMDQFADRPSKLQLVKGEHFPTKRMVGGNVPGRNLHEVNDVTELGALVHSMQQDVANQG